ncbi:hypothetical protein I79_010645 [Cricetulus griseus]|uniref:Uncharacterized protein n=1 Tax=Cricetulus griseus TaxID=10029 RepID=G3HJ11_CRIGR|nr:hypothetical protein I79_010645 [Cricetulus griseus]
MMVMDSSSETVSKPPIKCFLKQVTLVMVSLHSDRTVTKTRGDDSVSKCSLYKHENLGLIPRTHIKKA